MADTDVKIDVEDLKNDSFMNHLNSTLSVKKDYELHEYDYYWLEIIEDVLPYIDNILRNPKRFIVNEEDIENMYLNFSGNEYDFTECLLDTGVVDIRN